MASLTTQHQHQEARRQVKAAGFCYLCGQPLADGRPVDGDHVLPRQLFLPQDRTPPLKLPTHVACNNGHSARDEIFEQLVHVLHGQYPKAGKDRRGLRLMPAADGSGPRVVLPAAHLHLHAEIFQWVRGCHAALYLEHLPLVKTRAVHPPAPVGKMEDDGIIYDDALPQQLKIVEVIKRNRMAGATDRIVAYNGKFVFECTWDRSDRGPWLCFWAMRVYDWEQLGDVVNCVPRGCVGVYHTGNGKPATATRATSLQFPIQNREMLDPFAA